MHAQSHETTQSASPLWRERLRSRFRRPSRLSLCERGKDRYRDGRYLDAFQIWQEAAKSGSAEACYRIGRLYERGEGVLRSVPDSAAWFRRGAEGGHADASYDLA